MAPRTCEWAEVADRLRSARSYWMTTSSPTGAPHAAPVWGVVIGSDLHLYSERRTARARHVAADPRVVVHLESAEDVVIVHGSLEDVGSPGGNPGVVAALDAKYPDPADAPYLPSADPDFDVVWVLRPQRALMWRLPQFEESQARWTLPVSPTVPR
jgi:Pyridoxamine 5'-phosphate oxidase